MDEVTCYEEGYNKGYKDAVDRVRDWLKVNAYKYGRIKIVGEGQISFDLRTDSLIKDMNMVI